ncbi:MAG: RIP metalloprotease RseP [Nitrospiraceae bacterium]|nr:RIP metalloprotease RseP [Nitrospiraceae bacterium]
MILVWAAILLGVLIFVHEFGHFLLAKVLGVKVLKFSLGFGPKVAGFKKGDTEYMISALPLGGYVKMLGDEQGEELRPEERALAFNSQPVWKRMVIAFAGPFFNVLLTFVIMATILAARLPVNVPKLSDITPKIGAVMKDSPAEKAGLKAGDIITGINGKPVATWIDLVEDVSSKPGQRISVSLKRDSRTLVLTVQAEAVREKTLTGGQVVVGRLGIERAGDVMPFYVIEAKNLPSVPYKAAIATWRLSAFVVDAIKSLATGVFSLKTIGGPISIVQESGKAASMGVFSYLVFMAFISINLAVLNLLPVPILDGGHVLFLTIEAVRGRPLSEAVQLNLQRAGLFLLVTLMAFAIRNDIMRLIAGG